MSLHLSMPGRLWPSSIRSSSVSINSSPLSFRSHSVSSYTQRQVSMRCSNASPATLDSSEVWQRLHLVERQMAIAAADEDYSMAARLRDESKILSAQLSPVQKFSYSQVAVLKTGTVEEKLVALQALATTGEEGVLAGVSSCLGQPELREGAEEAMWAVFMHSQDPAINNLMREGMLFMTSKSKLPQALEVFERMIRLAPSYAEGYNKRATVLYSMERYADSAEDCKIVMDMQPYHYAAASGMGMCYMQLQDYTNAISAFNTALAIHPGMTTIAQLVTHLRTLESKANTQ